MEIRKGLPWRESRNETESRRQARSEGWRPLAGKPKRAHSLGSDHPQEPADLKMGFRTAQCAHARACVCECVFVYTCARDQRRGREGK